MDPLFNEKCRLFAKEVKKESGSWMSHLLSYEHLVMLKKEYNQILRNKRRSDDPEDIIYSFWAFDSEIQDCVRHSVRSKKNLTNDQLLKLLICVDTFYLPIDKIKQVVLKKSA